MVDLEGGGGGRGRGGGRERERGGRGGSQLLNVKPEAEA
jgi:hypothetical protein